MNRETKIGLLVGLAFIIVIGVLLSDHIQSSTQPQRAVLTTSGDTLRKGVSAPGSQHPGAVAVTPPASIEPAGQVATNDFLSNIDTTPTVVQIGPASSPSQGSEIAALDLAVGGQDVVIGPAGQNPPPVMMANSVNGTIVTPTSPQSRRNIPDTILVDNSASPAAAATGPARLHVAASGDSVYRMAVKYYGGYTKAREQLILRANPTLAKTNRVVIGEKYTIPWIPGTTPAPVPTQAVAQNIPVAPPVQILPPVQPPAAPAPTPVAPPKTAPAPAKTAPAVATYTVKNGDSLWKIANASGASVGEIKSLNKDVLKGSEIVHAGMKLKLPQKQMASAN